MREIFKQDLNDVLRHAGSEGKILMLGLPSGAVVEPGAITAEAAIEAGKAKFREYITTGKSPYSFSIDQNGALIASRHIGPKNGEVWGGLIGNEVIEIVPKGATPEEMLHILKDKIGLEGPDAEKFLKQLEQQREKAREYEKQFPIKPLTFDKPFEELLGPGAKPGSSISPRTLEMIREMAPFTSTPASPSSPSAQPHVVLKSGDTVGGLYNSIPKDQRPPFEQFKKEFMEANPTVTDPNKVIAGKDYALPGKYNYDELKQANRLIDPSVAEAAKLAVLGGSTVVSSNGNGHGVATDRSQSKTNHR